MRVLTVGNMYPPHHLGGYEQDWAAGVRALGAAGHDVRVLTSDHREPGVTDPDDANVERLLRWYWHAHDFPKRSWLERLELERHNRAVLGRVLASFEPDVVSWWPMGGMSMALIEQVRRADVPALGVVYDDWMVYGPRVDAWHAGLPRPLRRVALGRAARWLFCSESVRTAARAAVPDLADTDILAPGLDELFLEPAPEPQNWAWRLLAPGRLDPRKGLRTAVEAIAALPHAQLTIVGGGDARHGDELRALARELEVSERVAFEAPRPRAELARAYADADAVLFPVEWAEPFGLVPLEAMGIGRPVVATGRGGSGEFLRDEDNCLLFQAGDASALAAALERLASDAALRARLRTGGFTTAPAFARSRWDERIVDEHEQRAGLR